MQYLIEQYDTEHKLSYPKGTRESYEVNNWLFFMNAGYDFLFSTVSRDTERLTQDIV